MMGPWKKVSPVSDLASFRLSMLELSPNRLCLCKPFPWVPYFYWGAGWLTWGESGIPLNFPWPVSWRFWIEKLFIPSRSLTARPWKVTFPIGKACLPTDIFQGILVKLQGCAGSWWVFGKLYDACHLFVCPVLFWMLLKFGFLYLSRMHPWIRS